MTRRTVRHRLIALRIHLRIRRIRSRRLNNKRVGNSRTRQTRIRIRTSCDSRTPISRDQCKGSGKYKASGRCRTRRLTSRTGFSGNHFMQEGDKWGVKWPTPTPTHFRCKAKARVLPNKKSSRITSRTRTRTRISCSCSTRIRIISTRTRT